MYVYMYMHVQSEYFCTCMWVNHLTSVQVLIQGTEYMYFLLKRLNDLLQKDANEHLHVHVRVATLVHVYLHVHVLPVELLYL